MEVQTQVEIARRLNFLQETETAAMLDLATRVAQMTNALISALKRKS